MLWSIARKSRSGACTACALAVGLLLLAGASALAVDEPIKAATDRLEQIRAELDRIEAAAARPDQRPRALLEYREQAEPLRDSASISGSPSRRRGRPPTSS
jgi:secreted protein with Ig-like and vWFA domain